MPFQSQTETQRRKQQQLKKKENDYGVASFTQWFGRMQFNEATKYICTHLESQGIKSEKLYCNISNIDYCGNMRYLVTWAVLSEKNVINKLVWHKINQAEWTYSFNSN